MTQFTLTRALLGADLTVQVLHLPSGLQVTIYGGTLPHIGAISTVDPQGNISTQQFPTHKDGIISGHWAKRLSEAGYSPVVVLAGIHYDSATKDMLAEILSCCDQLLAETIALLEQK